MQLKNTQEEFERFAKYVIQQSRSNLSKAKKKGSGKLYNSLGYKLQTGRNSLFLRFEMEGYGEFVDKGVSGTRKKYNTPYSYKSKQPPVKDLLQWIKQKKLRFRDADGKYAKGSQKSLAFVIARSIKRKGIKPSLFFTKPFEKAFERLDNDVIEAFGLDIDNFLDFTRNG